MNIFQQQTENVVVHVNEQIVCREHSFFSIIMITIVFFIRNGTVFCSWTSNGTTLHRRLHIHRTHCSSAMFRYMYIRYDMSLLFTIEGYLRECNRAMSTNRKWSDQILLWGEILCQNSRMFMSRMFNKYLIQFLFLNNKTYALSIPWLKNSNSK